jgi:hypothetical protein
MAPRKIAKIPKPERRSTVEKVNCTSEVSEEQEDLARRPWQTPVVEEMLVNESENTLSSGSTDIGIYASS